MFDIDALDVLDSQLMTRKLTLVTKYNLILTTFIAEEEKKNLQTLNPDADNAENAIVESSSQQIGSLDKKIQPSTGFISKFDIQSKFCSLSTKIHCRFLQ
jgi:hypothetical protein